MRLNDFDDDGLSEEERPAAPPAAPAVVGPDENAGKGGSYMRDPDTGERVLISRTSCGE